MGVREVELVVSLVEKWVVLKVARMAASMGLLKAVNLVVVSVVWTVVRKANGSVDVKVAM